MGLLDFLKPKETRVYELNKKGSQLAAEKKYGEAVQVYDQAINLNPQGVSSHLGKGDALREMKKYEEAIRTYDKAIALNPQDNVLYIVKGDVFLQTERYEEAIQAYKQAIKIYPNSADAHGKIGAALIELGRYEEAVESYSEAGIIAKRNDYRIDVKKDHRGCYGGCVTHFHIFIEKKCDQLMNVGKYEEVLKYVQDGLSVSGDSYERYADYVLVALKKMDKQKEYDLFMRKYLEASDLAEDYKFENAYALMKLSVEAIMDRLNIKR